MRYTARMASFSDKDLSHLFALARIAEETNAKKRKKLLSDMKEILEYFKQLQEVDTESVEPMAGGTLLENVARDDNQRELSDNERTAQRERLVREFPEHQNDYLDVPPVF
jgi:aspartyl/glutamyl-tRNA(Asn/Gln) amidotransferase C subunit